MNRHGMILDLDRQESGRSLLPIAGTLQLGLNDGRPTQAEVTGELRVDNLGSRFLLDGTLVARGRSECARCLREFVHAWEVPVEIQVLRDLETDEGEGDSLVLQQSRGEVDLREPLRESVVLAYPQAPLCDTECRGLCPACGVDRNETECDCASEDTDPRWDGLP